MSENTKGISETFGVGKNCFDNNNFLSHPICEQPLGGIKEFYREMNVFITGATGFVGKAVLEKLLRSCKTMKTAYVLMRPKKNFTTEERLQKLLKNSVFDLLRQNAPELLDKVKVIQGDITKVNVGLSVADRKHLIENVNIVIHSAATVRFNESLKDAMIQNSLGTKRIMELCTEMKQLKSFVHISTAYSNPNRREVEEKVYLLGYDPESIVACMETLPHKLTEILNKELLGDHPNTYTFTKAIAEEIVLKYSSCLPCAIVRPSIVTAAWKEPFPGWVDNLAGITGMMMEIGKGSVKTIICNENMVKDVIPVDVVANTVITAAWHTVAYRSKVMRIYNCTSGQINKIHWGEFGRLTQQYAREYPTKYVTLYPSFSYRINRLTHVINSVIYHYVPAYILDFYLYCTKQKPKWVKICKKCTEISDNGEFFRVNEWDFQTLTFCCLINAVKHATDGNQFDIDFSTENGFQWDLYVKNYMLGIRRFILKDDLSTLPVAKTKVYRLYWISRGIQIFLAYICFRFLINFRWLQTAIKNKAIRIKSK